MLPFFIMGLFSSKTKIEVGSSIVNMGGTKKRKKFMSEVVSNTILADSNADIAENITNSLLYGSGNKLLRLYRYGRDKYTQGLPSGSSVAGSADSGFLIEYVKNYYALNEIFSIKAYIGIPNYEFWVNQYMTQTYGYDPETEFWLRYPDGVPNDYTFSYETDTNIQGRLKVFLTFYPPDVDQEDIDESNTIRVETPLDITDVSGDKRYTNLIYRSVQTTLDPYKDVQIRLHESGDKEGTVEDKRRVIDSQTGIMTDTITTKTYKIYPYHFEPEYPGQVPPFEEGVLVTEITTVHSTKVLSQPQYFMHQIGSGYNIELDNYYADKVAGDTSDYFPVVFFREWKNDLFDKDKYGDTERFKTGTRMLKIANIRAQDIRDGINENPDIGSVNHAYLMIGVSLNSEEQVCLRYLVEHFREWSKTLPYSKSDVLANPSLRQSISIRQDTFDVVIDISYAHVATKLGVIGKVGQCTKDRGKTSDEYETTPPVYDENGNQVSGGTTVVRKNTVVYFRRQINKISYVEVEVANLGFTNYIYKGRSTGTSGWDGLYSKEETFIVPMLYSVAKKIGLANLTQLTKDCYHMVFNSYVEKKIKWYQSLFGSGVFKIVLAVVAVIVTIYSAGTLTSGIVAAASAATAAGTSVLAAVSAYVAQALATSFIVTMGAKYLADAVGIEFFTIIVTIAMAYVAVSQISSATGSQTGLPWASEVADAIPAFTKGGQMSMEADFAKMQAELGKFQMYAEAKQNELEEAWNTFSADSFNLDYARMIQSDPRLYETMDTFLLRTLLSNVPEVVMESMDGFTDRMLTLPIGRLPNDMRSNYVEQ